MAKTAFSEVWEYADLSLGRMYKRWHQKEHTGKYKSIISAGISVLNTWIKPVPYIVAR